MPELPKIAREELIGRIIKITIARNRACLGITGRVIDETKHLISIETEKGIKKINKKGNVFQILYLGEKTEIKGERLVGAPEERIKSKA